MVDTEQQQGRWGRLELVSEPVLEAGEVIHHQPVYCLFLCDDLKAYADFFTSHDLNPTACRSQIAQISGPNDAQLRYDLLSGIYLPSREPLSLSLTGRRRARTRIDTGGVSCEPQGIKRTKVRS